MTVLTVRIALAWRVCMCARVYVCTCMHECVTACSEKRTLYWQKLISYIVEANDPRFYRNYKQLTIVYQSNSRNIPAATQPKFNVDIS
jgi:hypothetical protein